ncbi:MAG: hypothetical protein ACUVTZ_01070 [Armatimonadota bacterium]
MPSDTRMQMNGAEAMALAFRLAGVRIAYTYPITPQSEVMEVLASDPNVTCVAADSEYNVLAGAEGVLWAGERCAVATASQGLLYMSELMWEVAGNRLPLVMGVFSRGVKGPGWCLGAQQNDVFFMRDTGWLHFICASAQNILDMMLIAFRVAETVSLPAIVSGDGYYVSHEKEPVSVPVEAECRAFVGDPPQEDLPKAGIPASYGGLVPSAKFLRFSRNIHRDMERALEVFQDVSVDFARRFGRLYRPVEFIHTDDADIIIVTAGAMSGTAEHVVRALRENGKRIGLARIYCFRPFPSNMLRQRLASAKAIMVLDRNLAYGLGGVITSETRLALAGTGRDPICIPVYGFVAGLGGLDVKPGILLQAVDLVERGLADEAGPLFLTEDGIEQ